MRRRAYVLDASSVRICSECAKQLHGVARENFEVLVALLPRGVYRCEDLSTLCGEHMEDVDAGVPARATVYRDPVMAGAA